MKLVVGFRFGWAKVIATTLVAGVFALASGTAFAVHDQEFELEGNVAGGDAVTGPALNAAGKDWADLFDPKAPLPGASPKNPLPAHFGPVKFFTDFKLKANGTFDTSDDTTFTTGSKDTLNPAPFVDGGGTEQPAGWQCTKSNNVGNQVDLINVYAAAYEDPVTHEVKIYFGAERNGNNGTKNIGFWFLQDSSVGCVAGPGGATDFTGSHMAGDLFIVSEFSNGGTVTSINVYEWVGGADGSLNPTPLVSGGDCKTAPADTPGTEDPAVCATVNSTTTTGTSSGVFTPPWLTQTNQPGSSQSTDVQAFEFFEGGLSLTRLNLTGCFTRFLVNTRSSDSLTATIFDYAVGDFNLCGINVSKACTAPAVLDGPNPVIDPADYASFLTNFDVTITKSGPGSLYEPQIRETASFSQGDSCAIVSITGCGFGAPSLPVAGVEDGVPVQVCDTLVNPIVVRIKCDTAANGFINSVTATAATSEGGAQNLSALDDMTAEEACSASVNPVLSVNKICHDPIANHDPAVDSKYASHPAVADPKAVTLTYDNSDNFAGFEVGVFVQIENTGDVKLDNINLVDQPGVMFTPVTFSQGTSTHAATTFDGTLLPGGKAYFMGSYVAANPDANETNPCLAKFTDKVTVTATDATSGIPLFPIPMDTATCKLCACPQ